MNSIPLRPTWAVIFVALWASGCLAEPAYESGASASPEPETVLGRVVEGSVMDEEYLPIEGARIEHFGGNLSAATDAMGRYRLDGLPAAPDVVLQAGHPDYEPQTFRLDLRYKNVTEADFILSGGPHPDPYHETNSTDGLILCQIVFGSDEGIPGEYAASCGDYLSGSMELIREPFGVNISAAVVELVWEPQSAADDILGLTIHLATAEEDTFVAEMHSAPGTHYLRIYTGTLPFERARGGGGFIESSVHVVPSVFDDHFPANVGLAVEQSFTLHTTTFYYEPPAPTWAYEAGP